MRFFAVPIALLAIALALSTQAAQAASTTKVVRYGPYQSKPPRTT